MHRLLLPHSNETGTELSTQVYQNQGNRTQMISQKKPSGVSYEDWIQVYSCQWDEKFIPDLTLHRSVIKGPFRGGQ
ncbi:unnamed protein product [Calypogeia fissa]